MNRQEATNTFQEGMVMDFNPLTTPDNVVTNCLNGTLLTFNGNEYVLQNDMGNGRVETAYLPEGFVPLGTAELGGIIYIVSYNPLNNKCQIGSFPSPERNTTSDEINDNVCTLSKSEFKVDSKRGALVYYLKKTLNDDLTFNPGDKFIVYGDNIADNYDLLYNEKKYNIDDIEAAKKHTMKLSLGTITSSGQLVTFGDLKQYYINKDKDKPYHIMQYDGTSNGGKPDLDDYQSLIEQPYNVFNSKISGKLVLIVELVQFDQFDIELSHKFTTEAHQKSYNPNVKFNFSGSYPFIPAGVKGVFTLKKNGVEVSKDKVEVSKDEVDYTFNITSPESFTSYEMPITSFLTQAKNITGSLTDLTNKGYFNKSERDEGYILQYEFIPCMNWGEVSYLTVRGQIDLDKLGTGFIGLNSWRYYNEDNKCNLTWGLDIYEEEGYAVDDVKIKLTRLLNPTTPEKSIYSVNKKSSYCGVFYDMLPLNQEYHRLTKKLEPNQLYLAEIQVSYNPIISETKQAKETQEPRLFYRWLYTSQVFNTHYPDTTDFKNLELDFTPSLSIEKNTETTVTSKEKIFGIIFKKLEGLSEEQQLEAAKAKSSLSGIQTEKDVQTSCDLKVGLADSYKMFSIETQQNAFLINFEKDEEGKTKIEQQQDASIKFTDREDPNQEDYLKSFGEIVNDTTYNKYKLTGSVGEDRSDNLLSTPTNVVKLDSDKVTIDSFKDNTYSFKVKYKNLQLVKAYCVKQEADCTHQGRYIPLAYDDDTFDQYNLELNNNKWRPKIVGTFGFHENSGKKGYIYIGKYTPADNKRTDEQVGRAEEVSFRWTTDPNIANGESKQGWKGTAMFAIHWEGGNGSRQTRQDKTDFSKAAEEYKLLRDINRVILTLRSNKGDQYYYPICFNRAAPLLGIEANMVDKFLEFYNDFAMALNNLYRYDPEALVIKALVPNAIYYMDNCTYSLSVSLIVDSTSNLSYCKIKVNLESGSLELSEMLNTYKSLNLINTIYTDEKIKEDLEPNVRYNIAAITRKKFSFAINDYDRTSGIELRNYIADQQETVLDCVIMDYNGRDVVGTYPNGQSKTKLFVRTTINGSPSIAAASQFNPIKLTYSRAENNGPITVTASTSVIDDTTKKRKPNMNDRFTLNDSGLLVLNAPPASEVSFKRNGNDDTGTVDGYQNAYILPKYAQY